MPISINILTIQNLTGLLWHAVKERKNRAEIQGNRLKELRWVEEQNYKKGEVQCVKEENIYTGKDKKEGRKEGGIR